jgi:DNA polymerase-3 subunit delta'
MINSPKSNIFESSKHQTKLFGYDNHLNLFERFYTKKDLPKVTLFSGPKGLGKSTFVFHLINYFLSFSENNAYSIKTKSINSENSSYKLILENIHPNFYLVEKLEEKKFISIDEIRKLSFFLNKTTYGSNFKFIFIKDLENLNQNSSNALLKILENGDASTFFFITHNNIEKINSTILSRCVEFKLFFNFNEKKDIFLKLIEDLKCDEPNFVQLNYLHYDTPGNLLKYYSILEDEKLPTDSVFFKYISIFVNKYLKDKRTENLFFIKFFIQKFYSQLLYNSYNEKISFYNFSSILNKLHLLKKYNLDEKNIFFDIMNILENEKR